MLKRLLILPLFIFVAAATAFSQPMAPAQDSSQMIADRIVKSDIPVLVDFWAPWCGPCRMLNPIIKKLEKNYEDEVLFIKVNVDIHKALSAYFRVSSIPAVFIIHNKNVVKALQGVLPKEQYAREIDTVLKAAKLVEKSPPATVEQ
jgi:thioredoxin 1